MPVVVRRVSVMASNGLADAAAGAAAERHRRTSAAAIATTTTATLAPTTKSRDTERMGTIVGATLEVVIGTISPDVRSFFSARRSLRTSLAVWYRSSTSFDRQRMTIREKSRGKLRLASVTGRGASFMIAERIDIGVSPVNGRTPGRHLVEEHAEREHIRPLIDRLPFRLLRRHVGDRATMRPSPVSCPSACRPRRRGAHPLSASRGRNRGP